jgi:hypothetical protein
VQKNTFLSLGYVTPAVQKNIFLSIGYVTPALQNNTRYVYYVHVTDGVIDNTKILKTRTVTCATLSF